MLFNGKEKDNEISVDGGDYDYGFRIYDARLARFLSVDPLTDKNPTYTPYSYGDNNPILYIDYDGKFRMSARQQRKYPELANLLRNIEQTVHNDPKTYEAFKNTLGLTDDQAKAFLTWGKGPKVRAGIVFGAYAVTNIITGNITLEKLMIKALEGKIESPITAEGTVFMTYITVLHEAQHSAEVIYDKTLRKKGETYDESNTETEAGLVFEIKAVGEVIETNNADTKAMEKKQERGKPLSKDLGVDITKQKPSKDQEYNTDNKKNEE